MEPQKSNRPVAKSIVVGLFRIATSPLGWRMALFFAISLAALLVLVFRLGFPALWLLILVPLSVLFSFALGLRTLRNHKLPPLEGPKVYDKAKYHYGGDFPKRLPHKQAFVHTGMFVGWLIEHDMVTADFLEEAQGFAERKVTGAQVYKAWDGCLISVALTDEGNRFASDYFDFESGEFLNDYEDTVARNLPSMYHVADTWENYEIIKQRIDQRYEAWRKKQK